MLAEFAQEEVWYEKKGRVQGETEEESNKIQEMFHFEKKKLNQLLMSLTVVHYTLI